MSQRHEGAFFPAPVLTYLLRLLARDDVQGFRLLADVPGPAEEFVVQTWLINRFYGFVPRDSSNRDVPVYLRTGRKEWATGGDLNIANRSSVIFFLKRLDSDRPPSKALKRFHGAWMDPVCFTSVLQSDADTGALQAAATLAVKSFVPNLPVPSTNSSFVGMCKHWRASLAKNLTGGGKCQRRACSVEHAAR